MAKTQAQAGLSQASSTESPSPSKGPDARPFTPGGKLPKNYL